jgi:hypothetical protein
LLAFKQLAAIRRAGRASLERMPLQEQQHSADQLNALFY